MPLLSVLFASQGFDLKIYEAGHDTVEEAYNGTSGFYAFQPQMVVILQAVMKLKGRFYDASGSRESFSQAQADKADEVWKAIQSRTQVPIIQSTFVLPYPRTHIGARNVFYSFKWKA